MHGRLQLQNGDSRISLRSAAGCLAPQMPKGTHEFVMLIHNATLPARDQNLCMKWKTNNLYHVQIADAHISSLASFSSESPSDSSSASSSSGISTSLSGASGSTPSSLDINLYTRFTKADGSAISYPDSMRAVWKRTAALSTADLSSLSALTLFKRSTTTGWLGLISKVLRPDIIDS